jgi:pseudouridine-5'-monophosphatase
MVKKWPHKIRAVIFDNDGTLVDSEEPYTLTHVELTGQPLEWDFKVQMMGKTLLEACQLTVDHCHLNETAEEYARRFEIAIAKYWPTLPLMPGVEDLLRRMKSMNTKMAIATASTHRSFKQKVQGHPQMIAMMDHCVTGDDVEKGKPEPDLFLTALRKWEGIAPEEALVFEDSPLGILAANRAGIPSILVPDPHLDYQKKLDELQAKPLMVISSFSEFNFEDFNW